MKKLYYYNGERLRYEPLPPKETKSYYNAKRNTIITAACGGIVILSMLALGITYTAKINHYSDEVNGIHTEYSALLDSINDEMCIEKLIAQYAIDATVTDVTDDDLWQLLVDARAWYPEYIMAQYKIESGGGTSKMATEANNLFGMRKVGGKRKSYTTQEKHSDYYTYGRYKNWQLSALDRILYERFYFAHRKPDRETYLKMLASYAVDTEYLAKVEAASAKYK